VTTITTTTGTTYYVVSEPPIGAVGSNPIYIQPPSNVNVLAAVGSVGLDCTNINQGTGSFDLTVINGGSTEVAVSVDYWITDAHNQTTIVNLMPQLQLVQETVYTGLLATDPNTQSPLWIGPHESRTFTVQALLNRPGDYIFHAIVKALPTGTIVATVSQAFHVDFWPVYMYTVLLCTVAIVGLFMIWRRRRMHSQRRFFR
jgi:hypothetical protein